MNKAEERRGVTPFTLKFDEILIFVTVTPKKNLNKN